MLYAMITWIILFFCWMSATAEKVKQGAVQKELERNRDQNYQRYLKRDLN